MCANVCLKKERSVPAHQNGNMYMIFPGAKLLAGAVLLYCCLTVVSYFLNFNVSFVKVQAEVARYYLNPIKSRLCHVLVSTSTKGFGLHTNKWHFTG